MSIRQRLRQFASFLLRRTADPPPDQRQTIRVLTTALADLATREDAAKAAYMEQISELHEARRMAGSGPWTVPDQVLADTDRFIDRALKHFAHPQPLAVRESIGGLTAQGATGDIELHLQNVEWRREVNLSWLEFSRFGIQQLILICRLYFIKHPWIRRGITLSAAYVFGQGVELSSPDEAANEVLQDFRERNKTTLGQIALTEAEKRKSYDGNLFWCLFPDTQDTGKTTVRLIDATEMQEVWSNPEDADEPWYYRRVWSQRALDVNTGEMKSQGGNEWYPALGYDPDVKPADIGGKKVNWGSPVYHRKVGAVANWTFGCPRVYPAIAWSKEGGKILTSCASVTQALSQIAIDITTKGGQQAIEGLKQQWGTTIGPSSNLLDQNPTAGAGSTFVSGPGTTLQAFKTRGMGTDPAEVKEYRNMAACALEIPPTWLGDMETSNLSTAQTLDRPTELGFLLKQEEWQEDLVVMGRFALEVSRQAAGGRLRAAIGKREGAGDGVTIREAARRIINGHWTYEAAKQPKPDVIEVLCTFPAIREGDIPALVKATLEAMAIDRTGVEHGIDQKTAFRHFCGLLDIDNADELTEQHYPEATYQRDRNAMRKAEQDAAAKAAAAPQPGAPPVKEAARIREAIKRTELALATLENGHGAQKH